MSWLRVESSGIVFLRRMSLSSIMSAKVEERSNVISVVGSKSVNMHAHKLSM